MYIRPGPASSIGRASACKASDPSLIAGEVNITCNLDSSKFLINYEKWPSADFTPTRLSERGSLALNKLVLCQRCILLT